MQATNLTPTPQTTQVTSYEAFQPILAALKASIDRSPKSSLPTEVPGTFQENTHLISTPTTIYTEHGKIAQGPGNLIGRG